MTAGFVLFLSLIAQPQAAVTPRDALAHARLAYNEHRFDDAVAAAAEAGKSPELADSAAVVLARALLERYHASDSEHRETSDLDRAREALKSVNAARLSASDHVEFLVGLGESLFFDQPPRYSAAAEMFESALARAESSPSTARETLFEWWAEALDREAQSALEADRKPLYTRILRRAEAELARDPQSSVAVYWIAAASRGAEDLERAWGAAIAGWIRAGSLGPRGVTLRDDLDRLVVNVILPERARQLAPNGDAQSALTILKAQWEELKKKWERDSTPLAVVPCPGS
ncbi:MAG TPA: hypothetical protein VJN96_06050 [Vicinamibacterales bacterium]|nr:hypothetical protein [Vicinamibacterales bacterium]